MKKSQAQYHEDRPKANKNVKSKSKLKLSSIPRQKQLSNEKSVTQLRRSGKADKTCSTNKDKENINKHNNSQKAINAQLKRNLSYFALDQRQKQMSLKSKQKPKDHSQSKDNINCFASRQKRSVRVTHSRQKDFKSNDGRKVCHKFVSPSRHSNSKLKLFTNKEKKANEKKRKSRASAQQNKPLVISLSTNASQINKSLKVSKQTPLSKNFGTSNSPKEVYLASSANPKALNPYVQQFKTHQDKTIRKTDHRQTQNPSNTLKSLIELSSKDKMENLVNNFIQNSRPSALKQKQYSICGGSAQNLSKISLKHIQSMVHIEFETSIYQNDVAVRVDESIILRGLEDDSQILGCDSFVPV